MFPCVRIWWILFFFLSLSLQYFKILQKRGGFLLLCIFVWRISSGTVCTNIFQYVSVGLLFMLQQQPFIYFYSLIYVWLPIPILMYTQGYTYIHTYIHCIYKVTISHRISYVYFFFVLQLFLSISLAKRTLKHLRLRPAIV